MRTTRVSSICDGGVTTSRSRAPSTPCRCRSRSRATSKPLPELLSIGVVDHAPTLAASPVTAPAEAADVGESPADRDNGRQPARRSRRGRGKSAAKKAAAAAPEQPAAEQHPEVLGAEEA